MLTDLDLPTTLRTPERSVTLRRATEDDLPALVSLLADDPFGAGREDADAPEAYRPALLEVLQNASDDLLVAADHAGTPVAMLQLTRIPGLARRGATRLLVEAVRVHSAHRSGGIGTAVMRWVTAEAAPAVGACLVQLTSHEARKDAHRFYERLGFAGSHRGFKVELG
ncbi:hypothetical protein AC792_12405 [Arthrobacter sp. RIT-PI-e]|uniref:GNAT family N-acetyltransferase n=1 Tax=Arthrobacter sp. RIT-PI-e TaxID=1681197 RepID=UPI000676A4AF|nr:GNAT family N-acetyltransferase [Arthrobacter sp. RIT-PI-e]KNC18425.1 hypothetical protein AC792_12405 [Arthrobacter sp. RIT-PI-e]